MCFVFLSSLLAAYTCVLLCIAQVFYEVGTRTGHLYINNTSGACYFFYNDQDVVFDYVAARSATNL